MQDQHRVPERVRTSEEAPLQTLIKGEVAQENAFEAEAKFRASLGFVSLDAMPAHKENATTGLRLS